MIIFPDDLVHFKVEEHNTIITQTRKANFVCDKALVVDSRTIIIIIIKELVFYIELAINITLELSKLETSRVKSFLIRTLS